MDVRFSDEQEALRASVAQVVGKLGVHSVAQLDDPERAAKLDAAVDAAGWRELRAPELVVGMGARRNESDEARLPLAAGVESAIVADELGRGLADASFLGPTLAAELRRMAGAPVALTAESVLFAVDLSAPAVAVEGCLSPSGIAVDAQHTTAALLLVRAGGGHHLASVEIEVDAERVDLTRPSGRAVRGAEVSLLADQRELISPGDLLQWTALGLALTSADLVGVMRGAVELATAYAADRRQYGAAIGSFQAVQHLLADAFVAMEGSRSVALHAAWAVDAMLPADALGAAAVSKAYCSRAARSVCETAIQVHGGIGNTWECLAHVLLRRALLSIDVLGGVGASLERVAAHEGIGGRG